MILVILAVPIILLFVVAVKMLHRSKITRDHVVCFSGTLGSGKTYLAVEHALRLYRRQHRLHWWYKRFPHLFGWLCPDSKYPATLWSNIPVLIRKKHGKEIYSRVFTRDHLLMRQRLPEKAVVLIDEFGQMASQYEHSNPYVMEYVQVLVRFFRQFTDGYLVLTDQTSGSIVKQVRDRLGIIYYLHDFRRLWFVMPFYIVEFVPLLNVEDAKTNLELDQDSMLKEEMFFMGFLPWKFLKMRHYDSRCYRCLYDHPAVRSKSVWESLDCDYLIDISVSQATSKAYTYSKDRWRDFLYVADRASFDPELPKSHSAP